MRAAPLGPGGVEPAPGEAGGCRYHYRPAAGTCRGCGRGLCSGCLQGVTAAGLCPACAQHDEDERRWRELRRGDAEALRRAGYAVPRGGGDSMVLHQGPLRLALPVAGAIAVAFGAGALAAYVQLHVGLDVVVTAVLLAVPLGQLVRRLFGGVSPIAGATAAAVAAVTVGLGNWFAGAGETLAGAPLAGFRQRSEPYVGGGWAALGLLLVAILAAYSQAAGQRLQKR